MVKQVAIVHDHQQGETPWTSPQANLNLPALASGLYSPNHVIRQAQDWSSRPHVRGSDHASGDPSPEEITHQVIPHLRGSIGGAGLT